MRFTSRMALLAAAVCLPLAAALASYAIAADTEPPRVPSEVRVGEISSGRPGVDPTAPSESSGSSESTTTKSTESTTESTGDRSPSTKVVPPPPVDDDDDDDDDYDDDDHGDDD